MVYRIPLMVVVSKDQELVSKVIRKDKRKFAPSVSRIKSAEFLLLIQAPFYYNSLVFCAFKSLMNYDK